MDKRDLLLEIGCEELPAQAVQSLANTLNQELCLSLFRHKLREDTQMGQAFATPRRIAVYISDVKTTQASEIVERQGPALDKAYDTNGAPTAAAVGFAKSCGVTIHQLSQKDNRLYYRGEKAGQKTIDLLPEIARLAIRALQIPRPMRWGAHTESFVRPVHWVVFLFGADVVKTELFGIVAGNQTRGHRFHHPELLTIPEPKQYVEKLEEGYVIADYNTRKNKIRTQIEKETPAGQHPQMDENLLDEVTALVEWPVALLGHFNPDFLKAPAEALITSMQVNQKYFPILKEGKLQPSFMLISNIESKNPDAVIRGNERVLNARLTDAIFFYENDLAHSLESRLLHLEDVTFQKQLGSLAAKTERITALSAWIAEKIGANAVIAKQAAQLSKCDLMSEMVGEFPTLQGVMGYYYARHDGQSEACALAIKEHYSPRFSGDHIPSSLEGCAVALADKLDTLIGIFGINQAPTSDKDPFGLRRAALGVLRILTEQALPLDLKDLLHYSQHNYDSHLPNAEAAQQTLEFIMNRLQSWYLERNFTAEQVSAVLASGTTAPLDFKQRLSAIQHFQQLPEASALAAANKRVNNILKKQNILQLPAIDASLFEHEAERRLAQLLEAQTKVVRDFYRQSQYTEALTALAAFKAPVDAFFDTVMVMVEDERIRNNRLALLSALHHLFTQVADISLL